MDRSPRWALLTRFDILDERTGELYLRRWRILQTPWFGIYLHKIAMPDKDRDLHDHPWPFVSVVLRGGYDEQLAIRDESGRPCEALGSGECWTVVLRRGLLSIAFRRSTDAHRITRLHRTPTWTLVFVGRRLRDWGFYTSDGYKSWREYLGIAE